MLLLSLLLVPADGRAQDAAPAPPATPPERHLAIDPAGAATAGAWGFTLSSYGGVDQSEDQATTPTAGIPEVLRQTGGQMGLAARFNASHDSGRSGLTLTSDSTTMYFATADRTLVDANASAGQRTTVGRHTTIAVNESVGYAPYQSLGLFPGYDMKVAAESAATSAPTFEEALSSKQVYRYSVAGHVTTPISARSTLMVDYQRTGTFTADALANLSYQESGIRLQHQTSQSFGYHLGYAHAESGGVGLHHFRIGLDGRKALSRSRRTVISFGTDSTLVSRPSGGLAPSREFRLLGNADLDRYFGRTWSARLSYRRDVTTIAGYPQLVFREATGAAVSGLINARTTAGANGAFVLADVGAQTRNPRDRARSGAAWVRVAVARRLAVFAEYSYSLHQLGVTALELGVPPQFGRHSVHIGFMLVAAPRGIAR